MACGIGQGQGRAPGAAKDQSSFQAEMRPKRFEVFDKMPGSVRGQTAAGRGFTRAALIVLDDAVVAKVKESTRPGVRACARTAVQADHRRASGVSSLLVIEAVSVADG